MLRFIYHALQRLLPGGCLLLWATTATPAFDGIGSESISGRQLLQACQIALKSEYVGTEAMVCHWYVTPCDCHFTTVEMPAVCLPDSYDEVELTRLVTKGLKGDNELLQADAAVAANTILAKHYPCQE